MARLRSIKVRCKERDESVFTMVDSIKLLRDLQRQAVCIEGIYTVQMQLFGTGPENIELLNRSGSNVFAYFESLTDQHIILKLSAMTEDRVSGRETLSVKRLRYMLNHVPGKPTSSDGRIFKRAR